MTTKTKRTRVSKGDIARAREEILNGAKSSPVKGEGKTGPRYKPEQWIADNQVYIDSYGWCWGIMPHTLENQCLGREEDVKNTLATGVIPKNQCAKARIVLRQILDDIKEEIENAKPKSRENRRPDIKRGRHGRDPGRRREEAHIPAN